MFCNQSREDIPADVATGTCTVKIVSTREVIPCSIDAAMTALHKHGLHCVNVSSLS